VVAPDRPDYVDLLPLVAVPTLVVVGSDDEFTPVSDAQLIHDLIPNATLKIVDGAGHMPNLERQTEFTATVQHLLDSLSATASKER
jgi:3-oxoadipate enol-lactonase